MARIALSAALDIDPGLDLRTPPSPVARAVFIASHTDSVHLTPSTMTDMGKTFAMQGFDLDVIPYGQAVTPSDLQNADVVIVLPVHDYPALGWSEGLYDELWDETELLALENYVAQGGFLIVTNSAQRLKFGGTILDANEDWPDQNLLLSKFGLEFEGTIDRVQAVRTNQDHPLMNELSTLTSLPRNAAYLSLSGGQVLAWIGDHPALVLAEHGDSGGEVMAIADLGFFFSTMEGPVNLPFWNNLARYIRAR
jgi:hypothetical protein